MIWYIQYLWWLVVKWVGQNIVIDKEHDEVCVGEGFRWLKSSLKCLHYLEIYSL